jgi:predicted NBD/HSP70 family sugar kinase
MELKNHPLIKKINGAKILNTIRLNAPIARAQIAEKTGLDRKSLTNFISEFLNTGVVEEAGKKEQAKGRPFTMLNFKDNLVLGICIAPDKVSGVSVNFNGKLVRKNEIEYPLFSPRKTITEALKSVYSYLADTDTTIHFLGLCVPGVVDIETGKILASINIPGLKDVNLRSVMKEITGLPVLIEDATRAKALAEKWFGKAKYSGEFVCVDMDVGVGLGIVNNRMLYKGAKDFTGEIGHINVEKNGKKCACGKKGCLEAYLSKINAVREINGLTGSNYMRLEDFNGEISAGLLPTLKDYAEKLGTVLGIVINILNPEMIILNGPLPEKFGDILIPETRQVIKEYVIKGRVKNTELIISDLKDSPPLGAASLGLSKIFEVEGHYYV